MPTGDYQPIEKPKRVRNPKLWRALSKLNFCEHCGRHTGGASHCHHISSRGAGGNDERSNCIGLHPICHDLAHRGLISKAVLLAIASAPFRHIPGYDDAD